MSRATAAREGDAVAAEELVGKLQGVKAAATLALRVLCGGG